MGSENPPCLSELGRQVDGSEVVRSDVGQALNLRLKARVLLLLNLSKPSWAPGEGGVGGERSQLAVVCGR